MKRKLLRLTWILKVAVLAPIAAITVAGVAAQAVGATHGATSVASPSSLAAVSAATPVISYATSLISPANRINSIAIGADGTLYLAGVTLEENTSRDESRSIDPEGNAFVARLSADGSKILYFTYLDKSGLDQARAITVDASGNAYVTGKTRSQSFAVLGALQSGCGLNASSRKCAGNVFVTKLNSRGTIIFSTYLGGSGMDAGNAIALGSKGNIYVAGSTTSPDFPTVAAAQPGLAGDVDAFIAEISADTSHIVYATYLGSAGSEEARGLAVDTSGQAFITGFTTSVDFPTRGASQTHCGSSTTTCHNAFISELSADGSKVIYSTYLGGSGSDAGNSIALDGQGNLYVAGVTSSADFPTVMPLQGSLSGKSDAFVTKISTDRSKIIFSTYLGGNAPDEAKSIAVDSSSNVFVTGWTHSADFPTANALQSTCGKSAKAACSVDAFLAMLDSMGSKLQFSSYLGGGKMDVSKGIALDAQGGTYLGGWSDSTDLPKAAVLQMTDGAPAASGKDVRGSFVAKFSGFPHPTTVTCGSGTNNWTGTAGDNQWATPSNWSDNRVPISSDSVCIASSFANTINISILSPDNQTIGSIISGAPILFQSGGPLTVSGTATFSADLAVSTGVFTLNGSTSMTTFELSGGAITGPGTISVSGLLTMRGGSMCTVYSGGGCGTAASNAVSNANGGISILGYPNLTSRTLNNATTASYGAAYYMYLSNGAVLNNPAQATWDLSNGGSLFSDTTAVINNAGTFQSSGSGNSAIEPAFNNTGSVQVTGTSGQSFQGGGGCGSSCGGSWSVDAGATLTLSSGTFTLSGGISGAGTVSFGGVENLTGNYNVTGATAVVGGTVNFGTVTHAGALSLTGGVANLGSNALTVPTMSMGGGTYYGTGILTVTGLLTMSGGSMCTVYTGGTCGTPSSNAVTNANGGISIVGYPNLTGRTLNNAKTASYGAAYYVYLSNGATISNLATATWDLSNGGNLLSDATAVFNNAGTFRSSSGNSTIQPAFNNTGSVQVTGTSGQSFQGGGSCGSSCGGSWSVDAGDTLTFYTGTFALGGSISGAGMAAFSATVNFNSGSKINTAMEVDGGITTLSSGQTLTVPSLTLTGGTLTGPSTLTISGLLTMRGGSMCTVYSGGACGTAGSNAMTNANGGISILGYPNLTGRTLNTAKTASYGAAYYVYLNNGAILNNLATATWDLSIGGSLFSDATAVINNAGTFQSSGNGNSIIQPAFNNTGSVQVTGTSGQSFQGGGSCGSSCGGSWSVDAGATLTFYTGTFALSGNISGAGTVAFTGNENLTGNYNVTGATAVGGGTVNFGTVTHAGALTMTGGVANLGSNALTVPTMSLSGGTYYGTASLTVTGLVTMSGGSMCTVYSGGTCGTPGSNAVTNANGGISIVGYPNLTGRTLNTAKTASYGAAYYVYLNNGAILNNLATATWDLSIGGSLFSDATAVINNAGTFQSSGNGNSIIQPAFNNTGSVQVTGTSGQSFQGGGSCGSSCGGSWSVDAGATLTFYTGTFALSGNISGAGTVAFTGNENLTGNYNVTGATAVGGGTVNFGTVTHAGALTMTGGVANLGSNALTVPTMSLSGGTYYGTASLTVAGLLTVSGGSMCTVYTGGTCGTPGSNAVTNANGGISIVGYPTFTGRTLNNAKTASYSAAYYVYLNNGAVLNNLATATWDLSNGGNLFSDATAVINNAGTFQTSGSGNSTIQPAFNNSGSVQVTGTSGQSFQGGGGCGSSCDGSWSVATGATLTFYTGAFVLSGNISGAGTVAFSGTENLTGNYNVTGATAVGGGTVNFGTVTHAGALTMTGGVANLGSNALTVPTMSLSGGTYYGTASLTVAGLLTVSGGSMCTVYTGGTCGTPGSNAVTNANGGISIVGYPTFTGRTLNNAKTASYSAAYYVYLNNGAVLNNLATATWDLSNGGNLFSDATAVINNAGTFQTSGSGNSTIQPAFNNTGSVQTNTATMNFQAYTQSAGLFQVTATGSASAVSYSLNGGTAQVDGTLTLTNGLNVTGSGILSGTGLISGSVSTAGVTQAGDIPNPGILTIGVNSFGTFTQGSAGAYDVLIGGLTAGTQYSQLNAFGGANLSGALNVTLINNFVPAAGNHFVILTASAFNGQFSSMNLPSLPPNLTWMLNYTSLQNKRRQLVLSVVPAAATFTLTVTTLGTGNGTVFDDMQQINCTDTAGVQSGICSASYNVGTTVNLTASPIEPTTFGGWGGACSGTDGCSVLMNSNQAVTASFVPPAVTMSAPFTCPGGVFPCMNVSAPPAVFNCPSGKNPCPDPNAHSLTLTAAQVNTAFTMTVAATEVPMSQADGDCQFGQTPATDFDCRFTSFFPFETLANGDVIVPACDAYSNGNCVFYSVYFGSRGMEPPDSDYEGPITWSIAWNNTSFLPPPTFPYQTNNPRLYDDPDQEVSPITPYGTDCNTPMLINGVPTDPPIFCQFVFDITTYFDPNQPPDAGIGGKTKHFNDVAVAFPLTIAAPNLSVTKTADQNVVTAGNPIGYTVSMSNSPAAGTGTATNATLQDPLPAGTGVIWSINPPYTGPGTCAIASSGTTQVLTCSLGSMSPAITAKVHVLSANSSVGTYVNTATLAADNNPPQTATATIQVVSGSGPIAKVSPSSVDFGTRYVGKPAEALVTLTNIGGASMTISSIKISAPGNDRDDFFDLSLCPRTLAAGKACKILLVFRPDPDNDHPTATLAITDNAPGSPQLVPLRATVINPRVNLKPQFLNFGTQKAGTTSPPQTVTLTNSGTTSLLLRKISVNGNFALVSGTNCGDGTTLAPNAQCVLNVTFTPSGTGKRTGCVTIHDNTLLRLHKVDLSGVGD